MKSRILRILGPLSLLLASLLVSSCGENVPWIAPLNPEFVKFLNEKETFKALAATEQGHALGHIPSPIPPQVHVPRMGLAASWTDPKYDMRDPNGDTDDSDSLLTDVRDQGGCGSCWAFATYGALESHVKQTLGEVEDYSEDNLKHLAGFDFGPCAGGNVHMSTAYLSRLSGPISEADDPYDPSSSSDYCTDCDPVRYVDNVLWLPTRSGATDNDYIKQAILQYGGLYTSYYQAMANYDSGSYTYYYSGLEISNHAVVIVGWDDNKEVPGAPDDGAFIVRNSWGTSWFGEGGYFYVSYYDTKFAYSSLACFDERLESALSFDRVYYYDELGRTSAIGYSNTVAWGANWFVPLQDERLTAVGFYATDSPTDYEIYIYEEFDGESFSDLKATKTGSVPHPGWYTIELDDAVDVVEGDGCGVVIRFSNDDDTYPVPLETPFGGYSSAASASPGESYISYGGSSWVDMTSTVFPESNVCIKAFCSDPVEPIPLPAAEAYGRISGGDQTHPNEVNYSFEGTPGDITIAYEVYDVDFADEVEILINGVPLGYAEVTANATWSDTRCIVIPDGMVDDTDPNVLSFDNTWNPPNTYVWGVRDISIFDGCCDCMPLPDSGAYGRIVGGDRTHTNEVSYGFEGIPADITIRCQAYDVDFADEVEILVNDVPLDHAPVTPNETWSEVLYIVVPDDMAFDAADNVLTFSNTYNPPKTYLWGVKNVSVFEDCPDCIALPDPAAYGRILGGDLSHTEEVNYSFEGTPGDTTILYEVYDIDSSQEVEILVNGVPLAYAPVTLNESWSSTLSIVIPDDMVFDGVSNVFTFNNTYNPPKTYRWGVRNVSIDDGCWDCMPLPESGAYGRVASGDQTHVDEVKYSFNGTVGDVTVNYEVWDVDFSDEVEILVNGQSAGFAPTTPNEAWGPTRAVVLPDAYVNDSSGNVLTFSNAYNPPKAYWWGVQNVSLE